MKVFRRMNWPFCGTYGILACNQRRSCSKSRASRSLAHRSVLIVACFVARDVKIPTWQSVQTFWVPQVYQAPTKSIRASFHRQRAPYWNQLKLCLWSSYDHHICGTYSTMFSPCLSSPPILGWSAYTFEQPDREHQRFCTIHWSSDDSIQRLNE